MDQEIIRNLPVYRWTSQGGGLPCEGMKVRNTKTGREGVIVAGAHCTYSVVVDYGIYCVYTDTGELEWA
jgi:hypothetical protein